MIVGEGSRPSWRSIPGVSSWCQTSASLPSCARKISCPVMVTGRPVGGSLKRSKTPVLVPVMVHRPATNGPEQTTTYADQGTRDGLLANLAALIYDTTAKLHFGQMIADAYLQGRGPFP